MIRLFVKRTTHCLSLGKKASDCIGRGYCNGRCPFSVDQRTRMREMAAFFYGCASSLFISSNVFRAYWMTDRMYTGLTQTSA